MNDKNIFAQRFGELRKIHNQTQSQLISEINEKYGISMSKSMISKWENAKEEPTIANAKIIAEYYEVSLDHLFGLKPYEVQETLSEDEVELIAILKHISYKERKRLIEIAKLFQDS